MNRRLLFDGSGKNRMQAKSAAARLPLRTMRMIVKTL